jgi:4-hydroxy-tetrahydrodipicolinate reductase
MSLKVFVFGETGRMGQEVKNLVENNSQMEFVGGFSLQNPNLNPEVKPDVVVDFSLPQTLPQLTEFMANHPETSIVSGTTGWTPKEFESFKKIGTQSTVFWSANMSFGVYLMCQLTEMLARYDRFYKFHVEETHHIHKKDKPSGTAIIIENAAKKSTDLLGETLSYREGEVFGIHHFIGESENEKLQITHEAFNRSLFAPRSSRCGPVAGHPGPWFLWNG